MAAWTSSGRGCSPCRAMPYNFTCQPDNNSRTPPCIQHPVQLRQLILIQPAPGCLPLRGQPGRAASLPGPPPPLHRPFRYPQLSCNVLSRDRPEPLRSRQPDQFPPPAALGGETAALPIPHTPCIPLETAPVSPADIAN